jgi:hypothetical protein
MKKTITNNLKYLIAAVAILMLIIFGYLYARSTRSAPYEPGKMIEATSVVLDGNAGE